MHDARKLLAVRSEHVVNHGDCSRSEVTGYIKLSQMQTHEGGEKTSADKILLDNH